MPALAQAGTTTLPRRALSYLNLRSSIELAVAATVGVLVILWGLDGRTERLALVAVAVLTMLGLAVELPFLNRLHLRWTSYSVDPTFVYVVRGVLIRRSVLIPTRQILNVETVEGPLLRRFGFAKVRFRCITDVESLDPLDRTAVTEIRMVVALLERHTGE